MSAVKCEPANVEVPDRRLDQPAGHRENGGAAGRKLDKAESLDQRITRTENRIAGRRATLAAQAGDAGGQVRRTLSSPLLIGVAAGAGFLIAQFAKRRRAAGIRDEREQIIVKPSLFASLTDALTMVTTLLAMLPLLRRPPSDAEVKDAQRDGTVES